MKKTVIVATLVAAAMGSVSAFAQDGRINFTGEVIDTACTVTNNISNPLNVTLGKVAKSTFTTAGSVSSATKFTLALTGCPDGLSSVTVKFDGNSVPGNNDILAVTGGATGLGVQLADSTMNVLPLNVASVSYPVTSGAASMDFVARYIATADNANITSGQANATANFTINYN